MVRRGIALFTVLASALVLHGQEPIKSGPQVGQELPGPFHPLNVTGEAKGRKNCLYCANGGNPVAVVFAREATSQVAKLLKKLDDATVKHSSASMGSYAVFCNDEEGLQAKLEELAAKQGLKELILAIDSVSGPHGYGIAKQADVTVLLYSDFTVRANHAFAKGALNDAGIDRIVGDVGKIIPAK